MLMGCVLSGEASAGSVNSNWWSWQPLRRPYPPSPAKDLVAWPRSTVDRFIAAKLAEQGLVPSPEASLLRLYRRACFDLLGLPPSPEALDALLLDRRPDAYERAVDALLASPHYGERWGRHWLDLAHYGESNGFGMDRPRFHAWPYRDYVIDSFNRGKSFVRFAQEQLAADALFPLEPQWIPALGFAAAGPFNQSALVEQKDDTDCKRQALSLDRDDMVANTMSAFVSLTVHCARCHDHKFDPISQRDYYRMQAVFAGVGRTDRNYDLDLQVAARRKDLLAMKSRIASNTAGQALSEEEQARQKLTQEQWEAGLQAKERDWQILPLHQLRSEGGTQFRKLEDDSWLAQGAIPEWDHYEAAAALPEGAVTAFRLEVLPHDSLPQKGSGLSTAGIFALTEFQVQWAATPDATFQRATLRKASASFNQGGRAVAGAIDGQTNTSWGIGPQVALAHHAVFELAKPLNSAEARSLRFRFEHSLGEKRQLGRFRLWTTSQSPPPSASTLPSPIRDAVLLPHDRRTPDQVERLRKHHFELFIDGLIAALPPVRKVFAVAHDFPAQRNYKPPVPPPPIYVLGRGDVRQPREQVAPGALGGVPGMSSEFPSTPEGSEEGERRAALAQWITSNDNPFFWRSIANRVWQHHFGRGLCETPNDFGRMGTPPSHPELLDWLACELREAGGSLKTLHRIILTSAVYRQGSMADAARTALDGDNRFLWRMNRRRLDAESVRDSLLFASGQLNTRMGGPSVMQFHFHDPNQEVAPQVDYDKFDVESAPSFRRSVYRFSIRNINDPLLEAFDCSDPSIITPKRNVTITPLQSLSLLNNRFVLRQCARLAEKLAREQSRLEDQVAQACRRLWGRSPSAEQQQDLVSYARDHGLANLCRILVNSNEFLFTD